MQMGRTEDCEQAVNKDENPFLSSGYMRFSGYDDSANNNINLTV
jgi:hypothetical protein